MHRPEKAAALPVIATPGDGVGCAGRRRSRKDPLLGRDAHGEYGIQFPERRVGPASTAFECPQAHELCISRSLARRHRSQNYASQTQVRRRARKAGRSIRPDIAGLYHHLDPVISWHSEGRGTMHERSNLR